MACSENAGPYHLSVGTGWEPDYLDFLVELNQKTSGKVSGVFGGLPSFVTGFPSARPDFRLSGSDWLHFERTVAGYKAAGLDIAFTLNAPLVRSVTDTHQELERLVDTGRRLEAIGIDRLILANPLMVEVIAKEVRIPIVLSTIFNSHHPSNLHMYKAWGASRVCPDILMNRMPNTLKRYVACAASIGIEVEVLANEFCTLGSSPCSGVYRDSCYAHSALGGNPGKLFDDWPFSRCRRARAQDTTAIISAPYILPCHLGWYARNCGVRTFKISGRTKSVEERAKIVSAYAGLDSGLTLRDLWMEPDASNRNLGSILDMELGKIEEMGALSRWVSDNPVDCDFTCEFSCFHCSEMAASLSGWSDQ